jgi:hypothetical protein
LKYVLKATAELSVKLQYLITLIPFTAEFTANTPPNPDEAHKEKEQLLKKKSEPSPKKTAPPSPLSTEQLQNEHEEKLIGK